MRLESFNRRAFVWLLLVQGSLGSLAFLGCGSAPPKPVAATPQGKPEPSLHDDRQVVHKGGARPCTTKSPLACESRCNDGDAASCADLGDMYYSGKGVQQDSARAALLFVQSCEGGNVYGCAQGGRLVEDGDAGEPDPERAVKMYRIACEAGYEASCNDLGYTSERGIGQPKDEEFAYSMYLRSCELGGAYGCYNKAAFMEVGRGGTKPDPAASAVIYAKVCDAGFEFGCGPLGRLYYRGRGLPRDREKGLDLLEKSCKSGFDWSCEVLEKLKAEEASAQTGKTP